MVRGMEEIIILKIAWHLNEYALFYDFTEDRKETDGAVVFGQQPKIV